MTDRQQELRAGTLAVERLEAERARERMLATQNNNAAVEIVPQQADPSRARDAAAAAVGVNPR